MQRSDISDLAYGVELEKLNPIGDYVLVRMIEKERSSGGILLPKGKGTPVQIAEVVKVGSGITDAQTGAVYPISLDPGDRVLFMDYAGERMDLRCGQHRLIRCHGIWARVKIEDEFSLDLSEVEPRMDCLLVEPENEKMTRSGILFLPNEKNAQNFTRIAKVVSVGPGKWHSSTGKRRPMEPIVGQKILMTRYAGAEVSMRGKELRLIQEDDVHCIFEED